MLRILTDKSDWDAISARIPAAGVYLTYDYVKAAELIEEGGRAELAVWEHQGALLAHPYIRRPIAAAPGCDDITSAYEFGGFWSNAAGAEAATLAERGFAGAFATYCDEQAIISEFVRIHPFASAAIAGAAGYDLRQAAEHTVIDLQQPYSAIFDAYAPQLRTAIRKAERHGLVVRPALTFDDFLSVYYANLERLGARRYYYFAREFFERNRTNLELFHVYDAAGELCAAHVYLRDGSTLFSFLCHGVREQLEARPNDFAYDHVVRAKLGTAFRRLHLGGGHPSLLRYKTKFSPHTVPFFIATRIFDHARYEDLVARHERALEARVREQRYFPLYRADRPDPSAEPERNRSNVSSAAETE